MTNINVSVLSLDFCRRFLGGPASNCRHSRGEMPALCRRLTQSNPSRLILRGIHWLQNRHGGSAPTQASTATENNPASERLQPRRASAEQVYWSARWRQSVAADFRRQRVPPPIAGDADPLDCRQPNAYPGPAVKGRDGPRDCKAMVHTISRKGRARVSAELPCDA